MAYEPCGEAVYKRLDQVYRKHHKGRLTRNLPDEDVVQPTFSLVWYVSARTLRLHGYPAAATIRVVPLKQRAQGLADVEIVIDKANWDSLTDAQRDALLDHELEHLEAVEDKTADNGLKYDDLGRPRFRLRAHDWHLAGFESIAERHGDSALEVMALRQFSADRQKLLPFMSDALNDAKRDMAAPRGRDLEAYDEAAREALGVERPALRSVGRASDPSKKARARAGGASSGIRGSAAASPQP